jgi:hypothetical protein
MSFKEFIQEAALEEVAVASSPEQQNTDARADARTIVAKVRGLMQGRMVDANGNPARPGSTSNQQNTNAFAPDSAKNDTTAQVADNDESGQSMILKNNAGEVVYVTKGEDGLFITIVNKQRLTKRTIALDDRGATLLKRYI